MALIEVRDLVKVFRRGEEEIRALDSISLSIAAGEFVSVIGPSGCGKSTLMHILGLLDRQTTGQVFLDGRLTDSMSDGERSRMRNQSIGFVFQNFYLLPRATAVRNVAVPLVYAAGYEAGYSRDRIQSMAGEALERVGLSDRLLHRPNELSGGQRQRVAIARAIVNRPSLLLADEPTGNLDQKSGAEILALFEELNREGVTLVMVTHDPGVAQRAGRAIRLLDGRMA